MGAFRKSDLNRQGVQDLWHSVKSGTVSLVSQWRICGPFVVGIIAVRPIFVLNSIVTMLV